MSAVSTTSSPASSAAATAGAQATKGDASKAKNHYFYKLFRVKRKDGRVTTVSVDPMLVTKACQVMGGLPLVGKLVRDAAALYEDGMHKSCSGFCSHQLRQALMREAARRRAEKAQNAPQVEQLAA